MDFFTSLKLFVSTAVEHWHCIRDLSATDDSLGGVKVKASERELFPLSQFLETPVRSAAVSQGYVL